MNSIKNFVSGIFSSVNFVQTQFVPVRYRYYADKIAKGPTPKKFGYKDRIFSGGLLPRLEDAKMLPHPVYRPGNSWSPEKVRFGQNDYIDILGGRRLKPPNVCYDVPKWLRGKSGNELKLLILKKKVFSCTQYHYEDPERWRQMNRRLIYLYKKLNWKTKTGFSPKQ